MTLLKAGHSGKKKKKKSQKRIMREFQIHEISAVDIPAQSGATLSIMKRALEKGLMMTTAVDGHQHLLNTDDGRGGITTWNDGHDHPWVLNDSGVIIIGLDDGHDHDRRQRPTRGRKARDADEKHRAYFEKQAHVEDAP